MIVKHHADFCEQHIEMWLNGSPSVWIAPIKPDFFTPAKGVVWDRDWPLVNNIEKKSGYYQCYLKNYPGVSIGTIKSPYVSGDTLIVREKFWHNKIDGSIIHDYQSCFDLKNDDRWYLCQADIMPDWATRFSINIKSYEGPVKLEEVEDAQFRGECVTPDMVDSGGQDQSGKWVEIPDYYSPYLNIYDQERPRPRLPEVPGSDGTWPDEWVWIVNVNVVKFKQRDIVAKGSL